MSWQIMATRFVSYAGLLLAARIFMTSVGVWYSYWRQSVSVGPKNWRGFVRFCVPREIFTQPCVRLDIVLAVLRRVVGFWGVVPIAAMIALFAPTSNALLTNVLGAPAPGAASLWVAVFIIAILTLVHDFGEYLSHYLGHNTRILWEFHKVHHSVMFMTPLSAKRAHFVDDAVRFAIIGPSMGIAVGLLSYLFGLPPLESSWFGVDAYVIGNILSFDQLRHSHVPLTYGPAEAILMSPSQHHLHHNREGKPRNFGSFLAMWDRMFGTFEYSLAPGTFKIGLSPTEQQNYDSVVKLYTRPFWNVGKIFYKQWNRRRAAVSQPAMPVSADSVEYPSLG